MSVNSQRPTGPRATDAPTRILIVGYGRMGQMVERLAGEQHCDVAGVLDIDLNANGEGLSTGAWTDVDVAIDFTTPDAVRQNFPRYMALGLNVVVGTTGWNTERDAMRRLAEQAGVGVVAAPNFSVGAVLFEASVAHVASLLAPHEPFGAWLHEVHHDKKLDAPSGTALGLKAAMEAAGYPRNIDVVSSRAGHVPGIHTVGFDGPSETITLSHSVRDRGTFARGALLAARWVRGRKGWFSMRDVLGLTPTP
jgi:4-hydroxy-tetrahydrodipicolinate reductase